MADAEALPPTTIPKEAKTARARKFWQLHPLKRAALLLYPSEEVVQEYTVSMLESYEIYQLRAAITHHWDITPLVRKKAQLDHNIIGPLARKLIWLNWHKIYKVLSRPVTIPEMIAAYDKPKADLLMSPEGRLWIDWTCYSLMTMLAYHGNINMRGRKILPPPGQNPLVPPPSYDALLALPPGKD